MTHRGPEYVEEDRGYETPCWIWQLSTNKAGYAQRRIAGRTLRMHVVYWRRKHGEVPAGLVLDHLCRVRECVCPDHMEPVTREENLRRGLAGFRVLTADQVRGIREELASGAARTHAAIARDLGVAASTVSAVASRQNWKKA